MATGEAQAQTPTIPVPSLPAPNPKVRPHWSMNIIGIAGILTLCYVGESVLVVMLVSVLLAFILAPIVDLLTYLRLPRGLAAAIAILLLLAALCGIVYFSYNQAATLLQDLPKYTSKVRDEASRFRKSAERFEVLPPEHEKGVVSVRTATDWTDILTRGFGSVSAAVLAVSFVPFLVFFMLTWQQHVRSATVMLFPLENRHTAYVTLGQISAMVRSFMVGNVLIGLLARGNQHGRLLADSFALLLFRRICQRLFELNTLHGTIARAGAADICGSRTRGFPGHPADRHCSASVACGRAEPALSENSWQALAAQSFSGNHVALSVGCIMGSDGLAPRYSNYRRHKDHLCPRGVIETLRGLARGMRSVRGDLRDPCALG